MQCVVVNALRRRYSAHLCVAKTSAA